MCQWLIPQAEAILFVAACDISDQRPTWNRSTTRMKRSHPQSDESSSAMSNQSVGGSPQHNRKRHRSDDEASAIKVINQAIEKSQFKGASASAWDNDDVINPTIQSILFRCLAFHQKEMSILGLKLHQSKIQRDILQPIIERNKVSIKEHIKSKDWISIIELCELQHSFPRLLTLPVAKRIEDNLAPADPDLYTIGETGEKIPAQHPFLFLLS